MRNAIVLILLLLAIPAMSGDYCIMSDSPMYADWVGYGKWVMPNCWCYQWQCRGDIDGIKQGTARVSTFDLAIFVDAFGDADFKMDQIKICADLDHKKQGTSRVSTDDLAIFIQYFGRADFKVQPCPMDWDGVGGDDYNFWITP